MLSIHPTSAKQCTPNLLPARINHNGPIGTTSRYWTPATDENGTQHVHFRGRHLHGTALLLPEKYRGVVLDVSGKHAPGPASSQVCTAREAGEDGEGEDEDMEEEVCEEVKVAEQIGEFDSIVVWGHGGAVDEESDMVVRGLREWVGFAEAMHCDEEEENGVETNGTKTA